MLCAGASGAVIRAFRVCHRGGKRERTKHAEKFCREIINVKKNLGCAVSDDERAESR